MHAQAAASSNSHRGTGVCRDTTMSPRMFFGEALGSRNAIYSEVAGADTLAFAPRSEPVAQRSTNLSVWRSVLAHGKDGPNGQDASDAHHEPA
eukprot:COSAG02_NODE_950_length_15694_cov_34.317794_7_plen_93_part_00